ncbi:hypothetical protein ACLOJK_007052 [Asimina triloba]
MAARMNKLLPATIGSTYRVSMDLDGFCRCCQTREEEGIADLVAALLVIKLPEMGKMPDSMAATALPVGFEGDRGLTAGSGTLMLLPSFFLDRISQLDIAGGGSRWQPTGEDGAPYEKLLQL